MSCRCSGRWWRAAIGPAVLLTKLAAGGCGDRSGSPPASADDLLRADREFAAAVAAAAGADRAEAWAAWFAPDGRQLIPGSVVEGREAIAARMAPVFADSQFVLSWDPDHAAIAASGDLGWTTGLYESRSGVAGGETTTRTGRYVTIWRRTESESWRVALDTGVPDPVE